MIGAVKVPAILLLLLAVTLSLYAQADPWENALAAAPSWVELVIIGGDVVCGSKNGVSDLSDDTNDEDVIAWGKPMLIDTGYLEVPVEPGPRLAELRAKLIELYPRVDPIFASLINPRDDFLGSQSTTID